MDELTRERYPHGVPWREKRQRPRLPKADADTIRERRVVLCGTADMGAEVQGISTLRQAKEQRLINAIRRYSA